MSVSLKKGQKVDLTKGNSGLDSVLVGLGWDAARPKNKGLFGGLFGSSVPSIDCDASALLCCNGKIKSNADLVYFGNLSHSSGAIQHMGDNLTGDGDGDDEQIIIKLKQVPEKYDRIIIVVNIYNAISKKQHFGMVENAYMRIVDAKGNTEMFKYNLSENCDNMYALVFGELYRHDSDWKFGAIGEPTQDPSLKEIIKRFS